jgi:hypothetical protein
MESRWKNLTPLVFCLMLTQGALAANISLESEGQVAICRSGSVTTAHLLDYLERQISEPSFPRHENRVFDKVRWAVTRMQSYHPQLVENLLADLKTLPTKLRFLSQKEVSSENGIHIGGLPSNCKSQKTLFRTSGVDQSFSVVKWIWDKMPASHRAGLILHGLMAQQLEKMGRSYRYGQLRHLVSMWSQGGPLSLGLSRYVSGLEGLEKTLQVIRISDVSYRLDGSRPLRVHDNGQVAEGTTVDSHSRFVYRSDQGYQLEIASKRGPVQLAFHSTGVPREALLKTDVVEIPVQGKKLKFKYEVSFYPNGKVRRGFFLSEYGLLLKRADGRWRRFKDMEYHMGVFDEEGRLISSRRMSNINKPISQLSSAQRSD